LIEGTDHVAQKLLSVEQIMDQLAETPQRIGNVTGGLSQAQLRAKPGEDE